MQNKNDVVILRKATGECSMSISHVGTQPENFESPIISSLQFGRIEVDASLIIRKVLDKSVNSLLGTQQIVGKNIVALIKPRVSLDDFYKIQPFLKTLYKTRDLIEARDHQSPFDCLKVVIAAGNNRKITKFLRFEFHKSKSFSEKSHWVIVIRDISKNIRLSRQIRRTTQRAELKVNTMMSLLQFERDLIKDFLGSTICSLRDILKNLHLANANQHEVRSRIESIYCIVHQIKGDAAILNMVQISSKAHEIESLLAKLNDQDTINNIDIKALHKPVKSVIDSVKEINAIYEKIVEGGWNQNQTGGGDSLKRRLEYLVKRVADSQGKQVKVVEEGFNDSAIPLHLRRDLSSIMTQLARNAVVHGIEEPKERERVYKTFYGCLHVLVKREDSRLICNIRDDGAGVNFEHVRQKALKNKHFNQVDVSTWDKAQLMKVLFHPGFSTRNSVDQDAGRGVGLDYIKNTIEKHGGSISMRSIPGQFTEFTLSFPI